MCPAYILKTKKTQNKFGSMKLITIFTKNLKTNINPIKTLHMNTTAIKVTTIDYPIQMTVDYCETELSYGNVGIIEIKTAEDEKPKGILFNSIKDKHDKIKAIQLDALDYHRVLYFEVEAIRIKNPNLSAEDVMHLTTAYITTLYNQQLFTKI